MTFLRIEAIIKTQEDVRFQHTSPCGVRPGGCHSQIINARSRARSPRTVSHLVLTDGSLFLVSGSYVAKDGNGQSKDAANAANNIQNVHIGYLLESDSREAAIFRLPFRSRG